MSLPTPPLANQERPVPSAIVLTSHPRNAPGTRPIVWGAKGGVARGPVVATMHSAAGRNAIGTHSGAYSLYRALAVAAGQLDPAHRPDLTNTAPAVPIGPFPAWEGDAIVSMDPFGHLTGERFAAELTVSEVEALTAVDVLYNVPVKSSAVDASTSKPSRVVRPVFDQEAVIVLA